MCAQASAAAGVDDNGLVLYAPHLCVCQSIFTWHRSLAFPKTKAYLGFVLNLETSCVAPRNLTKSTKISSGTSIVLLFTQK